MNEEQQFAVTAECEQLDQAFDELTALLEQQHDQVPRGIRRDLQFWEKMRAEAQ
jgi:hypothetical protein